MGTFELYTAAVDYITINDHLSVYICHDYADHLVIDESTSYFAQASILTQRMTDEHLNLN